MGVDTTIEDLFQSRGMELTVESVDSYELYARMGDLEPEQTWWEEQRPVAGETIPIARTEGHALFTLEFYQLNPTSLAHIVDVYGAGAARIAVQEKEYLGMQGAVNLFDMIADETGKVHSPPRTAVHLEKREIYHVELSGGAL